MEQTNMVMAMFQTMTSTTELPKTGGKTDGESNDFQKLLEEKSQAKDPLVEDRPKTSASTKTTVKKTEKDAAQQEEDPVARVKKMLEQGAWITQPSIGCVDIDLETGEIIATYNPGEYILVHMGDGAENTVMIPTVDLEPWQRAQLQQMIDGNGQVIDVSDPKADAMLEATAPGADNSPAALLEQVVDEEAGQVIQQAVEEIQPQQTDDAEVEVTDVEQAPQRVFHDVKAAPVKVGEVYGAEQTDETDVVKQVEDQVAQAIQNGESTVTVKLTPENLGEVTVQINMKDGGIMAVAISARNDDTRTLLERHAANLQELLGSRVHQTVEVEVQRQQESQQNQNQQHQQNYDGHNGHAQDGQERRRQQREHTNSQDFLQQLRLGLIPTDGEL